MLGQRCPTKRGFKEKRGVREGTASEGEGEEGGEQHVVRSNERAERSVRSWVRG